MAQVSGATEDEEVLCSRARQAESGTGRHLVFVVRLKDNQDDSYKDQQKPCRIKKPLQEVMVHFTWVDECFDSGFSTQDPFSVSAGGEVTRGGEDTS